jgi:hypothetical protein
MFLTEKVLYTEGGYGSNVGYGDGTVMQTEFKARWHDLVANPDRLMLNGQSLVSDRLTSEESEMCFDKLIALGYIDRLGHQIKVLYPALEPSLPILCSVGVNGLKIAETLGQKGFPTEYGHSYDYGPYQELTKAKYFVGSEIAMPLQPETFHKEISGISHADSNHIWQLLNNNSYMIQDKEKNDVSTSHGKKGLSFIRSTLSKDLKRVDVSFGKYALPIERLLIWHLVKRKTMILSDLYSAGAEWSGGREPSGKVNQIWKMLKDKDYLKKPLENQFEKLLANYKSNIPDIVRVLTEKFGRQLGEAEFDVESYDIDANGNHKHYYTGFDRYQIGYTKYTNQIDRITFNSFSSSKPKLNFTMKHDSRGNVIQV